VTRLFDEVKQGLVAYLAVSSEPAGARVSLNGQFLSLTDFFPLEVIGGEYVVEVEREGYATERRTLTLAAGATESFSVSLNRIAASFFFTTEPPEVEIWVDGEHRATTGGSLSPDLHPAARAGGLDPTRASASTEVANLSLGSHEVEFRRRCYETARAFIEAPEAIDYQAAPRRLEPSLGSLELTSEPPGAQIFIDGEPMGFTPKTLDGVCSGAHRLEVKHASGKFLQDIVLDRNETLSLDCPIRPSLAFLGVVPKGASGERVAGEVREALLRNLSDRIRSLNFLAASEAVVNRVLGSEGLRLADLVPGAATEADVIRRVGDKLAQALEVQGFLIASLPDERLIRTAELHLLAAGNAVADAQQVVFSEAPSYLSFLSALDRQATVYSPWTGLITIDTLLHQGLPVLRVVPDSPAARVDVRPDDVLFAVDGQPVGRTFDFRRLVDGTPAGKSLSLSLGGPNGEHTVTLTPEAAPQEVPLRDPSLLYNKVMMDLRQQVEGYPGTEAAAYARLNLAIAAMHFEDFGAAHEHLTQAASELPDRPGISRGTAFYYLGLSLERLGYEQEALDAYRGAAGYPEATLFANDGPLVAPLAARRAER
jgi:tetratricopeptide (TPR) repeat protein